MTPEHLIDVQDIIEDLQANERRRKMVNIIVVAEGSTAGGAEEVARQIKEQCLQLDTRVTILGHIQRGGSPTCQDRILASRMGYAAVEALLEGTSNVMVGIVNNKIHYTPLEQAIKAKEHIDPEWLKITKILAS
jgi:6-phosphofructokinase 1